MREFLHGAALLGRGFSFWRRRPGAMALGLLPAAIVGALLLTGLIALAVNLPALAASVTPFAEGWPGLWAGVIRIAAGTAMLGGALVIVAVSFTAATLVVGEPFYERIWRAVEREAGDPPQDSTYGFWRGVGDAVALVARGVGVALLAGLTGLVPVVGGALGAIVGVTLTGWLLADELSSRALSARGIPGPQRRRLLRAHRARALGFGVATQLCFLVPLGAVASMPAAVAGSTLLARSLLAENSTAAAGHRPVDPRVERDGPGRSARIGS
ncbi:EI24 domain-containing protein [Microbacterium sp. NPDC078428]|uniref:EI24 domain-containing protein n=1 Tax=Microbacterium sp. NPDC078428 TaxID=3364190 RepID=UPI0037C76974